MKQKVYVLNHSGSNRGEQWENTEVYSSLEDAKQAMQKDIRDSKLDNFWWDNHTDSLNDSYVFEESDTSAEAYCDGWYDDEHESWNIEEKTIESSITRKGKKPMEM